MLWIAGGAALALVLVAMLGLVLLSGGSNAPSGSPNLGTLVQPSGGTWTNITPDTLATMLQNKDFTLLNVKTPYSGEIAGTDLYIPYDQLAQRATELPTDKHSAIVVYCRSGHESAMAAQTLFTLGYDNIKNLDGGMTAWAASGRQLVTVDRNGT